ncbi:MAG: aminodeoxychorismate synthase component I [Cyanophyceae cyanobacterium]
MSDRQAVVQSLNQLGSQKIPFLFILDFELKSPIIYPLKELNARSDILYQVLDARNFSLTDVLAYHSLSLKKNPLSFTQYKRAFDQVQEAIKRGNSFLVNLTFPTEITINATLKELFYRSQAKYKLWVEDRFVVFSPETFVEIKAGTIYTYPMKGTIDAAVDNAEAVILADEKEMAEHVTIVDLLRNDLSIYAKKVKVDKFRYLESIETNSGKLLQVSSQISGKLPPDYHCKLGNILVSLLPAGSISGAPKAKTLEIIRAAEGYQRGYYSGVFGIFDGTDLRSAVMIRFIEKIGNKYYFKSGGGITIFSEVEKEYQELLQKVYVPIV